MRRVYAVAGETRFRGNAAGKITTMAFLANSKSIDHFFNRCAMYVG